MAPVTQSSYVSDPSKLDLDLTRLPKLVVPKRYELKIDAYPDKCQYSGTVNIRVFFNGQGISIVWLHSVRLTIQEASIRFSSFSLPVKASEIISVPSKECIGIKFSCPIENGERAWLSIRFKGKISNGLEGFFSNPYVNKQGEKCLGAATMFAATEARTCFPCFDEPEFKAVFALEITVAPHLTTISNMPIMDTKTERLKNGQVRKTDYFEWTREMSTYLVCFVIGEYEYLETKTRDGRVVVRVYTPWGQREQGRFGLDVGRKSLEFFNDYFGRRYPLPKMDLVALSRLSVGAMENWGVITCRETGLITDLDKANPATLQSIATLIAHEISHQWFGNLVTMKWWDGLYLNEGFATLMQYMCIDSIYPEFRVFDRFCSDTVIPALGMDALQHSHPIEMPLENTSGISQMFDKITYCKGASVMFMLHEFIGADNFKNAIQEYMHQFSYDNATTEDLWHYLSVASGKNVDEIMLPWIRELGFPLVQVQYKFRDGAAFLELFQERFAGTSHHLRPTIWSIPLKGVYVNNRNELVTFEVLFDKSSIEIQLKDFDVTDPKCWVKLNPRLSGFYRVQYGETLFKKISDNLSNEHLTAIDRMSIFEDQVAMVLSEGGSSIRVLQMVAIFKDFETNAMVWKSVCRILQQFRTLTWSNEDLANSFEEFCLQTLRPVLDNLGYHVKSNETHNDTLLRSVLFTRLADLGDQNVQALAKDMFQQHIDETFLIPRGMKEAVFRAVMETATQTTFQQMLMLYRNYELAEDRVGVLHALGCAQDPNILSQALNFAVSPEVQPQESITVLIAASSTRHGHKMMWQFFTLNLDVILERYLGGLFLLGKLLRSVCECFTDHDSFREVEAFFAQNMYKFQGEEHLVEQAREHVELNVHWRDKDSANVQYFLESYFNA
ncbi:hypothetical protein TCAL_11865 [Tigriopus californicus]|uniref:Aminopeptidase n=1 Tax=Tigriopus californicus TaxID=6832 RepID=A0A553PDR9_TIGCA|nr:puromycin-sensitive aminopeptidase-like [Tigriopus californicus]TRY75825.1 hypothetical protein TCAL_11865 [Tigriopus californicus]|eukprot:TCALIF_11865-PA protein Name:"Similar to NPEPPS Puromycin-sensitive aminopeptidase (Homo sapiens)" AED:0.01 eAED:0.01 QI:0/-1/0/1/-1/1/1/0/896